MTYTKGPWSRASAIMELCCGPGEMLVAKMRTAIAMQQLKCLGCFKAARNPLRQRPCYRRCA